MSKDKITQAKKYYNLGEYRITLNILNEILRGSGSRYSETYNMPEERYFIHESFETTPSFRLDPKKADILCLRGKTFFKLGDFKKAIKDFTNAINIGKRKSEYFYCRGIAYRLTGNKKAAEEDFEIADSLVVKKR
jgi:tetratricopeptide (TPR) repeat protein